MKIFLIIPLVMLVLVMGAPFSQAQSVPDWVKNTAGWWATDAISETEFVNAIEFLVKEEIIQVTSTSSASSSESVPDWVKNTAGWWATDAISENEFVNAITFLVNVGIISVEGESKCVNDLLKYFDNKQKILTACDEHTSSINEELFPYDTELKFNSNGFRGEEFSEEKPSNVYRIFMVGGSTMLSSETSNDATIPSILQNMFDLKNLNTEIEIINSGISGGSTLSELELIKSKLVKYEPDLIIMYDGWNDLSADYTVEGTINNWAQVCAIGHEEKFEVIITLQPIAGFGNKILTHQEKINSLTGQDHNGFQLIQGKSTYDWLARQMQILGLDAKMQLGENACETHDLRDIFDNVNGAIYWDQGHVLHAGNLILAEKFFELSMKKIDSTFISEQKFTEVISNHNTVPILTYLFNEIGISEKTFQNKLKDTTKIKDEKGKYFDLKNEFDDISKSFVGKDLTNADLKEINLSGQDLTGANLSGQDLRKVDLTSTIIRGANLSDTNLEGKNLSGMDLRGINFSNANLRGVDFTDSVFSKIIQISGDCQDENQVLNVLKNFTCITEVINNESIRTDFRNADLSNAKFGNLEPDTNQMIYFADFINADLSNIKVNSVQFFGCNFSNTKLDGMAAKQMFIVKSDFNNTMMNNFEISETWIQTTSFNNVEMTNGIFDDITFIDTHFLETNLDGTIISNLNEMDNNTYDCKNNPICNK